MSDPIEFARVLGLHAEPDVVLSPAAFKLQKAELNKFLETFDLSTSEIVEDAFWAKFSALYLPRFLQSYIDLPLSPAPAHSHSHSHSPSSSDLFLDRTSWVTACVGRPYFTHLVRTKADLPLALMENVVERVAGLEAKQVAVHPTTGQITATVQTLGWLLNLRSLLQDAFQLALSSSIIIPPPSPDTLTRLSTLLPAFKALKAAPEQEEEDDLQRVTDQDVKNVEYFARYLEGVQKGGEGARAMDEEEVLRTGEHSWWRCEAFMDELAEEGECEVGKTMMKCGRCHTVRYCSADHQRLHYKNGHKKVCFAPAW